MKIQGFKEFLLSENPEDVLVQKSAGVPASVFVGLPEFFKHYCIVMRTIINSRSFSNSRKETVEAIKYCFKNVPQSVYSGHASRSNYVNTDELIDFLATGKYTMNLLGYYSFASASDGSTQHFSSRNRHTILVEKDQIKGIDSVKAAEGLLDKIVKYIKEEFLKNINAHEDLDKFYKLYNAFFKEYSRDKRLRKIHIHLLDPFLDDQSSRYLLDDFLDEGMVSPESKQIKNIIKFFEAVKEKDSAVYRASPYVHADESEVFVLSPIDIDKKDFIRLYSTRSQSPEPEGGETSYIKKNLKSIISQWSSNPKKDWEDVETILKTDKSGSIYILEDFKLHSALFGIKFAYQTEEQGTMETTTLYFYENGETRFSGGKV